MPVGAGIAVVGAAAGYMNAKGQRKQQQQQNKYMQQAAGQYSPDSLKQRFQQMNPAAYGALIQGERGNTGYQQSLYNMANNPGYIDPRLMNQSLEMSAQRQQSDMQQGLGMIGRAGGEGGLASAAPLASLAARTQRDVGTMNQYGQLRSQLMRQDIGQVNDMINQGYGGAMGGAQGTANYLGNQQAPMGWSSIMGNALIGGLTAYGTSSGGNTGNMAGSGRTASRYAGYTGNNPVEQNEMPWQMTQGAQQGGGNGNGEPQNPLLPSSGQTGNSAMGMGMQTPNPWQHTMFQSPQRR